MRSFVLAAASCLLVACAPRALPRVDAAPSAAGPSVSETAASAPFASARFDGYRGASGCAKPASQLAVDPTMRVVLVSLSDECTGLGGQYLMMSDRDNAAAYVTGHHGCMGVDERVLSGEKTTFGLVRPTGPQGPVSLGPCVGTGRGERSSTTAAPVDEIILVESEAEARRLLAAAAAAR